MDVRTDALSKRGPKEKDAYKKRWCSILEQEDGKAVFSFYDDEKAYNKGKKLGSFDLAGYVIHLEEDEISFALLARGRESHYFQGIDANDAEDWVDAFVTVGCDVQEDDFDMMSDRSEDANGRDSNSENESQDDEPQRSGARPISISNASSDSNPEQLTVGSAPARKTSFFGSSSDTPQPRQRAPSTSEKILNVLSPLKRGASASQIDGVGSASEDSELSDEDSGDKDQDRPSSFTVFRKSILSREQEHSGYLDKRGKTNKSFQKRWCLLSGATLSYHVAPKKPCKGIIYLKDTHVVPDPNVELVFHIDTAKRTYTFRVTAAADRTAWIHKLTLAGCTLSDGSADHMREILTKQDQLADEKIEYTFFCQLCRASFGVTRHRHFCRKCRSCVCAKCSTTQMQIAGSRSRVCISCFEESTGKSTSSNKDKEELKKSVEQCTQLKEKFDELYKVNKGLSASLERTNASLENKTSEVVSLKDTITNLQRSLEDMTAEKSAMTQQLQEKTSEIETLTAELERLREECDRLQTTTTTTTKRADTNNDNNTTGVQPPRWVPNEEARECMICTSVFTLLRRRHHCRKCGRVLCQKCTRNKVALPEFGSRLDPKGNLFTTPVRVCIACFTGSKTSPPSGAATPERRSSFGDIPLHKNNGNRSGLLSTSAPAARSHLLAGRRSTEDDDNECSDPEGSRGSYSDNLSDRSG